MSLNLGMIGRNQIRLVRQNEAAECGLASMAMIANYHGLDVDLASLRQRFPTSLRGAALKTLIGTADRLGLAARAVRAPIERIGDLKMPAILH